METEVVIDIDGYEQVVLKGSAGYVLECGCGNVQGPPGEHVETAICDSCGVVMLCKDCARACDCIRGCDVSL